MVGTVLGGEEVRLRTIYETDDNDARPGVDYKPSSGPVYHPPVTRRYGLLEKTLKSLGSINPSTLIDSGVAEDTWAFIYSAEKGLFMSSHHGYHSKIIDRGGPTLKALLRNIYFGGEQDQTTRRVDYKNARPGCSGRIGHNLKVEGQWQDKWLINFFDTGAAWYGNAIEAILSGGHAPATALVSNPADGQIVDANEFLAKHRPQEQEPQPEKPATPPLPKSWQGELKKLMRPGQKWWAPTSEGKK